MEGAFCASGLIVGVQDWVEEPCPARNLAPGGAPVASPAVEVLLHCDVDKASVRLGGNSGRFLKGGWSAYCGGKKGIRRA